MSNVALIISTHDGTSRLDRIALWIGNQKGWTGSLIVVASGSTDIGNLRVACDASGINLVFEKFAICGLAKRNRGAEIARDLEFQYVTFLNDYQNLEPNTLQHFESELHMEDIVFGNVQFDFTAPMVRPRISNGPLPLSSSSSVQEIWALFSSVSEAGLLIRTDFFHSIGGWQYPLRKELVCLGGDGMLLVARAFTTGREFGYSPNYQVLGGHKNLQIAQEMLRSKGAMYPYAFTLSTKLDGMPRWVAPRFILGRIFRLLQRLLRGETNDSRASIFEINSRLRAYFNLPPSKQSSLLTAVLENNCHLSQYLCDSKGSTPCQSFNPNTNTKVHQK